MIKVKSNIPKVIERLAAYGKGLDDKVDRFCQRLAELGVNEAQSAFGASVSVTYVKASTGYSVLAQGRAVCFLEFGAGLGVDTSHPAAAKMPFPVEQWSWSKEHSQEGYLTGEWHFGGNPYTQVIAVRGMERASSTMRNNILQAAREVFGE